jgi:molybdate transport system ATP-binding protein
MSLDLRFQLARGNFTLDVAVQLPSRGVTAVFGPSGCGKSTLLRCVAGLERRAHGQMRVGGETWQDGRTFLPPEQRPLGMVFQDAALFAHLNVRDNIAYGVRRAVQRGRVVADVPALAELLGISALLDRDVTSLSGGEAQRVAIARALAHGPRILLLDEPLAALDAARKRDILPFLERLHATLSIPVLYVSHAIDEVARLADHLLVLENGRVRACGDAFSLFADPALALGEDDEAGVLIAATAAVRDEHWHLLRADFPGGSIQVRDTGILPGAPLRLRVLARDVSLALSAHGDSSILNALPATVQDIVPARHPAMRLVKLAAGSADGTTTPLLARITARSAEHLALRPGLQLWAQVKSVAVLA